MNIKEYLDKHLTSRKRFADKVGINSVTFYRIVKGLNTPSLKLAILIEKATDGQVTVYSWANEENVAIKKEVKAKIEKIISIKKKKKILNSSSRLSASISSCKTSRIKKPLSSHNVKD